MIATRCIDGRIPNAINLLYTESTVVYLFIIYTKYISTNHNKSPELKRMIDRTSLQRYEICEKLTNIYVVKTTDIVEVDR